MTLAFSTVLKKRIIKETKFFMKNNIKVNILMTEKYTKTGA